MPFCNAVLSFVCADPGFDRLKEGALWRRGAKKSCFCRRFGFARMSRDFGCRLGFAGGDFRHGALENEGVFEGYIVVYAVGFNDIFPASFEMVYAEAVFVLVYGFHQPMAEAFELSIRYLALEDRILNPLPEVFARRGDVAKATPAGLRLGVHVVGYEDVHCRPFISG